ncbi:MAG TPA: adenylosuccinate lyase, partial [Acidimicrobiia bacterium]|nr:adenylosuccinate lyase [Acidimicrobiia bacterium]
PLAWRPMIARYSLPEMAVIWSDDRRLAAWKEVEALAVEAWAKKGVAPPEVADAVRSAPTPTAAEVAEREKITNHDLAAFVDLLAAAVGPGGEWIHYGLTSSDVLDTATALQLGEAASLLLAATERLFATVRRQALAHRHSVMVGRTHGIWAEPTSFGLKLASWAFELARAHQRLIDARQDIAVGKISGAVGTYAHSPADIEEFVCSQLGLRAEPASTQVVPRDRHAAFLSTLALVGASLERFATEIRHLQRSEVSEVREPFAAGQKGSSAMPHKRNPILAERITGLARVLRGYAQVGLENVALWHERDISHSAAERIALPDACLILHYMLVKLEGLTSGMVVNTQRMRSNLEATQGLVFSQAVLLALVEEGMGRDEAYRIVQENAIRAWEENSPLQDLLAADSRVRLPAGALSGLFDPQRYLRGAEVVFQRLESLTLAHRTAFENGS